MSHLPLLRALRWPENEYEGSVWVRFADRELEARAVLSGAAAWSALPARLEGELVLLRVGAVVTAEAPASLTRVGRATYVAVGPVIAADEDRVTVDVGFPLVVDLDPLPGDTAPTVGDVVQVTGELQLDLP